jgi:hypothetical protein
VDERYPIGETGATAVAVLRHERRDAGYPQWAATIGLRGGEATLSIPGHYAGVLAERLRVAAEQFAPGARLARDEYLDLTALARGDEETLALSSTSRSPARVTIEVPRSELEALAALLESAHELIETLRQGVGLVPDSLPDPLP